MGYHRSMKNLVLITSEFPYFAGEPFLQNELPYLSNAFGEIYIFSIHGRREKEINRRMPYNVRCFPLGNTVSKTKYLHYLIRGIGKTDNNMRIEQKSIMRIAASLYTRGRALSIADQVLHIIEDEGLHVNDCVVYSFWFAYQAVAACIISKRLNDRESRSFAIARAHGYDLYWERALGGFLPYQDFCLKYLVCCYPCSEYGTEYLKQKYPWASEKIKTSRLGTNDYGLNPYKGEKTIVTCCNLEPLKRMGLFAEMFCEIAREDELIKWICIGAGVEEETIKKTIKDAGLTKQVVFTGRVPNDMVMEIYKKEGIKIFCNISTTEGLPVSIMEAMSFGIPVIATDVGGTSELVDDSIGELLPAEISKEDLAKYIVQAINENEINHLIKRENARSRWEDKVSAKKNYGVFVDEIISL